MSKLVVKLTKLSKLQLFIYIDIKYSNKFSLSSIWESLGVKVMVSISNVATEDGCEQLIKQAMELGQVGAIYNLAGVLRDKLFDDLDQQAFNETLVPKALATKHLDKISRVLCPNLKHFVVFSSIACGRGNIGQSNYSMANSVMERIVEERQRDGLPGKAIQWGAIGDVGMLAETQLKNIGKDFLGCVPQPILLCIEVLDTLLTSHDPIVSSMIVADKKSSSTKKRNIIDIIFNIMGIRDRKTVSMDSSLTQLGIDSLTGVELQQTIEREFDISLTSQELRSLSLNELTMRVATKSGARIIKPENDFDASTAENWLSVMIDGIIGDDAKLLTTGTIVTANSVENNLNTKVLIFPGLIGYASNVYRNLAKKLDYPAYILQLDHTVDSKNIDEIMKIIIEEVLNLFSDVDNFILIGHSFGTILALKVAKNLEQFGKHGQIIQLDGSPELCIKLASQNIRDENSIYLRNYLSMILFNIMKIYVDSSVSNSIMETHNDWESRIKVIAEATGKMSLQYHEKFIDDVLKAYRSRSNILLNLKIEEFDVLETTKISLVKATQGGVMEVSEDYGLSKFTSQNVFTTFISGDHGTIMRNPELSSVIKKLIEN